MIRRLVLAGLLVWVGRWLALEVAVRLAKRRPRPAAAPKDSPRRPGWMPGPFDQRQ